MPRQAKKAKGGLLSGIGARFNSGQSSLKYKRKPVKKLPPMAAAEAESRSTEDYEQEDNNAANEEILNQFNVAVKEFNLLDEDSDGLVTQIDQRRLWKSKGQQVDEPEVKARMDQQWRQLDIDDAGRIDLRQFLQALSLEHIYDQEQAHKQAEAKEAKSVNAAREGAAMDNRAAQVGKKRNSKGKESDQALRQVVSSEVDNILDTISGDSAGAPAGDGAAGEDGAGDSAVRKPSGGNNKKKQSKGKLLSREEVSKEGNGAGPGAGGGTPSKEKKEKQARTPRTPKTPGGGGANGDGGDTPGGSVGGPSVDLATASRQFAQAMKAFAGGDIREGFATLDADNDGTISRTEFKIALVTLGIAMNDADRKRLRKAMDTNNDKKLTFEEVDAYVARHSGKGGEGGVVVGEDGVGATGSAVKAPAVEKQKKEKPKSPKKLPPMVKLQPLSLPGAGSGLSLPSPLSGAGSPVGSLGASMGSAASLGGTGTSLSSPATFEQQSVNNLTGT